MERSKDHDEIAAALAEARPAPRQAFAQELDQRISAGFPRRSRFSRSPLASFARRIGGRSPVRLAFAGASVALVAIAIAIAIIVGSDSGSRPIAIDSGPTAPRPSAQGSEVVPHAVAKAAPPIAAPGSSGSVQY